MDNPFAYDDDDTLAALATMPRCPDWCVDCRDVSDDRPGSRHHRSALSAPIPAHVDLNIRGEYVTVRTSYYDVFPALRRPEYDDYTPQVELCIGGADTALSLAPSDARRLAEALVERADAAERTPDTREPSPST